MKGYYIVFGSIILLAAALRLFQLGVVPGGVTHDELGYIYNVFSIAKTGKNVFGESFPFITWMVSGGFPFLPVPIYLAAPIFWFLPLSGFSGRLLPALLGIADVLLVYFIVKQLFKHTPLALLSALFLAISPWHLHFSRSAYDANYSLFFFLLGIAAFLYEIQKKRLPVISISSFLFALFSYRGMNAMFPALVLLLIWYGARALTISKKQLAAFIIGILAISLALVIVIAMYGKPYVAEANIFGNSKMQQDIDTQIREAGGPLWVRRLFLNKATYIANTLRENYVRPFSPEFLFLYSEPSKIYSIWSRGRVYFLDLFFIMLGIVYLLKLEKRAALFTIGLFLMGGLPSMIGGYPYSSRNLFIAAIVPIFVAGGSLFLYNLFRLRNLRFLIVAGMLVSYAYVFGSYLFDYYGRYALYAGEAWAKSLKDISILIEKEKGQYDAVVVGTASFGDFVQYAFYAKVHPAEVQQVWAGRIQDLQGPTFRIGKGSFIPGCFTYTKEAKKVLYIVRDNCEVAASPSSIVRDYPGNPLWDVYSLHP